MRDIVLITDDSIVDHKWKRDNFERLGKWWERFRLLVKTEDREGNISDWVQAYKEIDRGTAVPFVHIPVSPR